MNTQKIRVYFAHKLTKAPEEFLQKMRDLKAFLKDALPQCEFLEFLGVTDGTAADVYEWDIKGNVATCDLFVAFLDEESTGVGIELGAALYGYKKPILLLATTDVKVSRLPLGAACHHTDQIVVHRVTEPKHVQAAIICAIESFRLNSQN